MVISWLIIVGEPCRFEEVNLRRREGIAKVVGTTICIGGAVTMSVYKGMALFGIDAAPDAGVTLRPFEHLAAFLHPGLAEFSVNKFHLGVFFLILNCVSWAVYLTCQVPTPSNLFLHKQKNSSLETNENKEY